jgi:hypothetical protein
MRFLVAFALVGDLFLCAKHLFFAAMLRLRPLGGRRSTLRSIKANHPTKVE